MHNRCLWNSLNSFAQRVCRRYGVCAVHVQAALCCVLCCLHTPHLRRVQVFATALQTQALESCWTRYSTPLLQGAVSTTFCQQHVLLCCVVLCAAVWPPSLLPAP
jgi:hypothetical protein